jgi:ubiquinone/menaquinone biosynthesis C-methylase UbiE
MPPASSQPPPRRRRPLRTPGDPVSPFDGAADDYDGWFDGEGKLVFETELRALEQVLADLPRPWLEVGSGSGRFADSLGIDIGIDPSAELLRRAAGRQVEVVRARGEQLPFADATFGAVFIIVALPFVEWPLSVLRETRRVLQPGGKMVLAEIPRTSQWGKLHEGEGEAGHPIYRLADFRSYPELIDIVERGSLSLQKIVSTLVQAPGEVREVEEPQNGLALGASFVVLVAGKRGDDG